MKFMSLLWRIPAAIVRVIYAGFFQTPPPMQTATPEEAKVARFFKNLQASLRTEFLQMQGRARTEQATGKPVDLEAIFEKALKTVDGLSESGLAAPAAGRFNVSITMNTVGDEGFLVIAENTNCDEGQMTRLRSLFHAVTLLAVEEAPAEGPLAGPSNRTTVQIHVTDSAGTPSVETAELVSLAQKAMLDVKLGEGIADIGRQQLEKIAKAALQSTPAPVDPASAPAPVDAAPVDPTAEAAPTEAPAAEAPPAEASAPEA